ncbi:MAG: CSLREA domain-containing protein [Thermoanaerobaculales bacterium]|nr:CSLREA domain-containing protein [Thermoanaerobaculales bacterium]
MKRRGGQAREWEVEVVLQGFRVGVVAAAFLMAIPGTVGGADFFVSTTVDTNDGICDPPYFPCSLRDAIPTAP